MTLSWIALVFCTLMGLFQLALALVNTNRGNAGVALMNTVLAIVIFSLGALNVPFIVGIWS